MTALFIISDLIKTLRGVLSVLNFPAPYGFVLTKISNYPGKYHKIFKSPKNNILYSVMTNILIIKFS